MTDYSSGLELRRHIVGATRVEASMSRQDTLNKPFQDYLNEHVWDAVWTRDGLDIKARSLVVVSCLIALNRPRELAIHAEAAMRNGWTIEEIREVILQTAVYCGAPAAVDAIRVLNEVLADKLKEGS